jgi:hypothetical protein
MKMIGKTRKRPQPQPGQINIEALIEGGGKITIGSISPFECVASATDEQNCLAMLVRQPHESLDDLLQRLDAAIEAAYEYDHFIDEVNGPR